MMMWTLRTARSDLVTEAERMTPCRLGGGGAMVRLRLDPGSVLQRGWTMALGGRPSPLKRVRACSTLFLFGRNARTLFLALCRVWTTFRMVRLGTGARLGVPLKRTALTGQRGVAVEMMVALSLRRWVTALVLTAVDTMTRCRLL